MPYTALPDRRLSYDNDGTVVGYGANVVTATPATAFAQGFASYMSGADKIELNDADYVALTVDLSSNNAQLRCFWFMFPERREVTAASFGYDQLPSGVFPTVGVKQLEGAVDSTNGVDGTWEVASFPSGVPNTGSGLDQWRATIKPISLTGAKGQIRFASGAAGGGVAGLRLCHLYGEKAAGQTPDDLIFIDHDTTPGAEYTAPEDFGDRPLGTSVVRQFRVKNVSPTQTANSINIQCNDSDFAISTDGVTWVVTINIASLAAGAESATLYIRNTTPDPGALLGPRFARIVAIVGSWT